jgi:hypothetical protein
MLGENRLTRSLAEIREKYDGLTPDKQANLDREMDVSFEEHFAYQNAQARAHAAGRITTDEAQLIYAALGEVGSTKNGGWAAGTDTPTKVVVTLTIGQLLGR